MSADYCEAIEGQFAWFAQQCMKRAVGVVNVDGRDFSVCQEHLEADKAVRDE